MQVNQGQPERHRETNMMPTRTFRAGRSIGRRTVISLLLEQKHTL